MNTIGERHDFFFFVAPSERAPGERADAGASPPADAPHPSGLAHAARSTDAAGGGANAVQTRVGTPSTLKRPWEDGTTHLEFEPLDLLARLAALTPRPRINLILYHGVLAPRAAWRGLVVRLEQPVHSGPEVAVYSEAEAAGALTDAAEQASGAVSPPPADNHHWAELMRRSFGIDVLACPRCGGRLALIAIIEDEEKGKRGIKSSRSTTRRSFAVASFGTSRSTGFKYASRSPRATTFSSPPALARHVSDRQ